MKRLLTLLALTLAAATSFAATLNPITLLNPAGSTAGQAIVSTGPSTAPAWGNAAALAAQAANTVVANVTASSASPTAVALPSCSTANSALKYTSASGFTCGTTYGLTTGTLAQFAATTSAQLAGIISDETGSGSLVFGTNPTMAGATFTGNIIFNYPTPTTTLGATWQSNGSARWILQNDGTAETGSNAGSNLVLVSRTDAGAFLSQPIVVNRASGLVQVASLNSSGLITPTTTVGIKGTNTNDSAQAGSWGEYQTNSTAGTSMTTVTAVACTSVSLTAGDWDVSGTVSYRPAGTTTVAALSAGINGAVANTTGNNGLFTTTVIQGGYQTGQVQQISTPVVRESLASTTTIFLVGYASFGTSTMTCDGIIRARRVR